MENSVSRSTIINFLKEATAQGIIEYELETCKGGHRRRYYTSMNEEEYREYIIKITLNSLMEDFPETIKIAKELFE